MSKSKNNNETGPEPAADRRGFIKCVSALALGGSIGIVPLGAGLAVLTDPLARKTAKAGFSAAASLDAIPADGAPRKFTVEASQSDAWNRFPRTPIGAVYLQRVGENKVRALNVACPHAGCFVDYDAAGKSFYCPCHRSRFALDGAIADAKSPSPRGMDELEVEIRNGAEVWIRFQNFIAGHKEKIAAI